MKHSNPCGAPPESPGVCTGAKTPRAGEAPGRGGSRAELGSSRNRACLHGAQGEGCGEEGRFAGTALAAPRPAVPPRQARRPRQHQGQAPRPGARLSGRWLRERQPPALRGARSCQRPETCAERGGRTAPPCAGSRVAAVNKIFGRKETDSVSQVVCGNKPSNGIAEIPKNHFEYVLSTALACLKELQLGFSISHLTESKVSLFHMCTVPKY